MSPYDIVHTYTLFWRMAGLHLFEGTPHTIRAAHLSFRHVFHISGMVTLVMASVCTVVYHHWLTQCSTFEWLLLMFDLVLVGVSCASLVKLIKSRKHLAQFIRDCAFLDSLLQQLRVKHTYKLVRMVGLYYVGFVVLVPCHEALRYLYWCPYGFICAPYIFATGYAVYLMGSWASLYCGMLLMHSTQIYLLNKHLEREVADAACAPCDDLPSLCVDIALSSSHLYKRRATSYTLEMVCRIIGRLCLMRHAFHQTNSLIYFCYNKLCVCLVALILFCYIYQGVLYYHAIIYTTEALIVLTHGFAEAHFFHCQTKRTVRLMTEWHLLYYDSALIATRNSLILQTMHALKELKAGGALPMKPGTLLTTTHIVLLLVILLVQTSTIQQASK